MAASETVIRKQIDIKTDLIKPLSIEAIEKGHASLKNYMEHLITLQGERAAKAQAKKK